LPVEAVILVDAAKSGATVDARNTKRRTQFMAESCQELCMLKIASHPQNHTHKSTVIITTL
jgi:hypothetical protein